MSPDAPPDLRITVDRLAVADHHTDPATHAHLVIGDQLWRVICALGYHDGRVLATGDGAAPLLGIPGAERRRGGTLVADLYPHRWRSPVTGLGARHDDDEFDIVITTLPGYDVRLTYGPNINRRRADQLAAALAALHITKRGGLTTLLATHDLMDDPAPFGRRLIAQYADLIGAVRLPAGTYRHTAGTDAVTDVLLLRRRPPGQPRRGPDFEHAPGVYLDGEVVTINTYFDTNIDQVLGRLQYDPTGVPPMNLTVTGQPARLAPVLADRMDYLIYSGLRHDLARNPRVTGSGPVLNVHDVRALRVTVRRLHRQSSADADEPRQVGAPGHDTGRDAPL